MLDAVVLVAPLVFTDWALLWNQPDSGGDVAVPSWLLLVTGGLRLPHDIAGGSEVVVEGPRVVPAGPLTPSAVDLAGLDPRPSSSPTATSAATSRRSPLRTWWRSTRATKVVVRGRG